MSSETRRSINELITLHELEPTLKEVFVEGLTDVQILRWFMDANSCSSVPVYSVDTVEVTAFHLAKYNLTSNNRNRLFVLAHELKSDKIDLVDRILCIIDKDLNSLIVESIDTNVLILTDYSSLEMYTFSSEPLGKFLTIYCRGYPISAADMMKQIAPTLKELFLIRATNEDLRLQLSPLEFQKYCVMRGREVASARDRYLSAYLNKNGKRGEFDSFLEHVDRFRQSVLGEERNFIHGHDYVNLLAWYLSQSGNSRTARNIYNDQAVERALFGSLEVPHVVNEGTFQKVLSFCQKPL